MARMDEDGDPVYPDTLAPNWGEVKESITEGLLNLKDTSTDLTLVDPDNPADFGAFAKTLLGTLIAILAVGASAIQQAMFNTLEGYPTGIGSFVDDIVTGVFSLPGTLLEYSVSTTEAALQGYSLLSFAVAIAIILVALWIANKAVEVFF